MPGADAVDRVQPRRRERAAPRPNRESVPVVASEEILVLGNEAGVVLVRRERGQRDDSLLRSTTVRVVDPLLDLVVDLEQNPEVSQEDKDEDGRMWRQRRRKPGEVPLHEALGMAAGTVPVRAQDVCAVQEVEQAEEGAGPREEMQRVPAG